MSGSRPSLLHHEAGDIYFTNAEGQEVYLAGLHTWTTVQDRNGQVFDNDAFLRLQQQLGSNFVRLWASDAADDHGTVTPSPFMQAADGRFDLTKINPEFLSTLRGRVEAAGEAGLYASVMLFNGWAWHQANSAGHSPYSAGNNVNGISAGPGTIMSLNDPAVIAVQEAYVRAAVNTVKDLPNVLYEVANEASNNGDAWAWQNHMLGIIKQADGNRHPAGITAAEWWSGDRYAINGDLARSDADWTSPDGADYMDGSIPSANGGKVSVVDTDHLWGIGGSKEFVWEAFTRGHNVISMDTLENTGIAGASQAYLGYAPDAVTSMRAGIQQTRAVAELIDLNGVKEHGSLSSTGFALADPADGEFIVYAPNGGHFTVDLSEARSMTLSVKWMDVDSGTLTSAGSIAGGNNAQNFTAPSGRAALVLTDRLDNLVFGAGVTADGDSQEATADGWVLTYDAAGDSVLLQGDASLEAADLLFA